MRTGIDATPGGYLMHARIEAERRAQARARTAGRALAFAIAAFIVLLCSVSWGADPQPRPLDGPMMPGDL